MANAGDRLALVVGAWTTLVRSGDAAMLERLLDEHVAWQGLRPHLACHGRDEVMSLLERFRTSPLRLTRLEAEEAGDRVAVSVEGPDFPDDEALAAATQRSLVFTFRDEKVVRMESFRDRDAAFAALVRE